MAWDKNWDKWKNVYWIAPLLLRGIFNPLDAYCFADDKVLGLALVRQEAVEPANWPDEPDPELPLDPFRSGGGELGAIQKTCRILGWGLGISLETNSARTSVLLFWCGNYKLRHVPQLQTWLGKGLGTFLKILSELHPMSCSLVSPKQKQGRMSTPYCRASLRNPLLVFTLIVLSPGGCTQFAVESTNWG